MSRLIKILLIIGIWILIAGMNLLLVDEVIESVDKLKLGYSLYESVGTSIVAAGFTLILDVAAVWVTMLITSED